ATSDATATELTINGEAPSASPNNYYPIDEDHSYAFTITIHARERTASAHAMFKRMCLIQESGGTVSMIGSPQVIGTDINPNSLAISITADNTHKSLKIA